MTQAQESLRDKVYNRLLEEIITGRISDGEKLSESNLAKRFDVSRTPIREALFQLEKLGYVVHQKNTGSIVKKITSRGIREIYDVIAAMEGHAVEVLGEISFQDEDFKYLESLQEEMKRSADKKDYRNYYLYNNKFHYFLSEKANNRTLLDLVSSQRNKIYSIVARGLTLPMHIQSYLSSHEKILEAIKQGNTQKAGKLMKSHVREAGYLVSKYYETLD